MMGGFVMSEETARLDSTARLLKAQERAQRRMKMNYWAEAVDYLLVRNCFVGASLLMGWIEEEAKAFAD